METMRDYIIGILESIEPYQQETFAVMESPNGDIDSITIEGTHEGLAWRLDGEEWADMLSGSYSPEEFLGMLDCEQIIVSF